MFDRFRIIAAALTVTLTLAGGASAANLTWDGDSGTSGVQDVDGKWDGSTPTWTDDGGTTNQTWTDGSTAVFGSGSGATVDLDNSHVVDGIEFNNTYSIDDQADAGGTIDFGSTTGEIHVANGEQGTIQEFTGTVNVDGSAGITKTGGGTLRFGGGQLALNYSGGTRIEAGIVQRDRGSFPASTGTITLAPTGSSNATYRRGLGGGTIGSDIVVEDAGGSGAAKLLFARSGTEFSGNITLNKDLTVARNDTKDGDVSLSGDISGTGGLTIDMNSFNISGSTATLSGQNTYSGDTVLGSGSEPTTFRFDGTQGNSNITLQSGSPIEVTGNGTLTYNVVGDTNDLIEINTSDATLTLDNLTLDPELTGTQTQDEYAIINTNDSRVSGQFANVTGGFSVDYDGTSANPSSVVLVIPEPASLALLAPAGLLMVRRRRS